MEKRTQVMSALCTGALLSFLPALTAGQPPAGTAEQTSRETASLRVVSRRTAKDRPPVHGAIYASPDGVRLVGRGHVSEDNGRTWAPHRPTPDFKAGLPHGYRREEVTSVVDPNNGRLVLIVNALDTPGLDPKAIEPRISLSTYYLRYRVSEDAGRTWRFDEPIVHEGDFAPDRPFEDVRIGTNALFLGDAGSIPLVTRGGRILVPIQATMLGEDGKLWNPTGATTFTDVFVAIGSWSDGSRLRWRASKRVQVDPGRSTRGLIEPTLAQFADGRILMVMRGSNAGNAKLPSYRWFSVSADEGQTWTDPAPWTYDDGETFFSPSSMSTLLKHSTGRVFWVGNVSESNCSGNSPRWPVVLGEVDPETLTLVRRSVLQVDTRRPEDEERGRLDLCHFRILEDRETRDLVLTYPRSYNGYKEREWATVRIAVK